MVEIPVPYADLNKINEGFTKLVNEQSERSAIIVMSARIESLTEDATGHYFPGVKFGGQVRQLDALVGLGVLDDQVYKLLKLLANVRNHYAHSGDDCSLKDPEVKTKVQEIITLGDAVFNTTASVGQIETKLTPQLTAKGIPAAPGWFTTELNHLILISTMTSMYLLALANVPVSHPAKLDPKGFSVKT